MKSIGAIAFTVAALFTVAIARAEPIIVFDSGWNRDLAVSACLPFRKGVAQPGDDPATVFDCQTATNTRGLGTQLEYEVQNKFAVTARCKGVTVLLPELDGNFNFKGTPFSDIRKPHWQLVLYYYPGSKAYAWALFEADSLGHVADRDFRPYKMVKGEGTPAQIADEACIVVTGQGASIP
jgi:hypothetical protein